MNKKQFLICGGDLRQIILAQRLVEYGYGVNVFGFDRKSCFSFDVNFAKSIEDALENVDVIVLPLPASNDGVTVNTPMSDNIISIAKLFDCMHSKQIVVGGKISERIYELAKEKTIYITDYFECEELNILNAVPTAEGAIQIAMEELPITIHGSKCLVLGYGRIGKILTRSLSGLGADVFVSARKNQDFAWIKTNGYHIVNTSEIIDKVSDVDIIFNTIPTMVLDSSVLEKVNDKTLIIDLASKPGGVDFQAASQLNKKVIWALSLPGKVAPITAGIIMCDTILNVVNQLGV